MAEKCIKCFVNEAVRGEFCKDCFTELLDQLPTEDEFELPNWDDIQPIY